MATILTERVGLAELSAALIEGPFENPLWNSFLELLRLATSADYAILICQPPGRPIDNGLQLVAGAGVEPADIDAMNQKHFYPLSPVRREWSEEGKPHTLKDLIRLDQGAHRAFYRELKEEMGIIGIRQVRVTEPNGVDAWLTIARRGTDFTAGDAELLMTIAPLLRGMLRNYVARERDRFTAALASEAVRRLQCGWLVLDRGGHVLAADEFGEMMLRRADVIARDANGRLIVRPAELEAEVLQFVNRLVSDPTTRPRPFSLRSDPWLDMLLLPARKKMLSATAEPAVIAYIHADNWSSVDRCSQLIDLFGLSLQEARLALALCRGKSITAAADELGLAIETARSYSKIIYAKTGAHGMADLVRIIMGSILALAPDA